MRYLALAASLILPISSASGSALDIELVNRVAGALAAGTDPSEIEGVNPLNEESEASRANVVGCNPAVADGSSRASVILDFICQHDQERFSYRVWMYLNDQGALKVEVDGTTTAIGPTQAAQVSNPASKRSQFRGFVQAVRSAGDMTLDHTIPLTTGQMERLSELAPCKWDILSQPRGNTQVAFVRCKGSPADRGYMVIAEFDENERATAIRIEAGGIVRRAS